MRLRSRTPRAHHDDLAVEHDAAVRKPAKSLDELGEVARQRPVVATPDVDVLAVAKRERPEPVPLRLVRIVAPRKLAREPGEHRLERGLEGKRHPCLVSRCAYPPGEGFRRSISRVPFRRTSPREGSL